MKKEDVIKTCYSVIGKNTPLDFDCGHLCGGMCCAGDDNTGMLIFPGEEVFIDPEMIIKSDSCGNKIAVCNGKCDRNKRPLACRIYPLFPIIMTENGKEYIEVDFDRRANCPLTAGDVKISRRFCKAVRRVGKYLLLNDEMSSFYRGLNDEQQDYTEMENLFLKK